MQGLLGLMRTQLISLICGLVALAAFGFAVLGMSNMSVIEKLNKSQIEIGAAGISGLRANAKNQECVDRERTLARTLDEDYRASVEAARRINHREPLMSGVFPKAEQDAPRFAFKSAYKNEVARLGDRMGGGTLPTPDEIEDERVNIAESPNAPTTAANVEPKYDPEYRARVRKAGRIRCYVDPSAFQANPLILETGAPAPEQMWYAQVSLWIQQDVVHAIDALNRAAARKLADGAACVEHSPIKRLIALRIPGYFLPSNEVFDVLRFELTAVVDSREILNVVDAIAKANFNKLLAVECQAVDRDVHEQQLGYFYGTSPVALVRMEFETYMVRDVFDKMKPSEVVARLAGQKPGSP